MSDLEIAFDALELKRPVYDKLWRYYDSDHPLKYSTERLQELFRKLDVKFVENWCSAIVNAVHDRVSLKGFLVNDDKAATDTLNGAFKRMELDLDADDIHLAGYVCGESFAMAWKEDDLPQGYYHDPRMCHVEYDAENPREKRFAAKRWEEEVEVDENKSELRVRINLYYADHVEYYVSKKKPDSVRFAKDFIEFQPPQAHEFGSVPIFHFRRERRDIISEMNDSLTLQDAVNKLLSDMMVSSEFSAFQQRFFVTNADLTDALNSPNEHIVIPAASTDPIAGSESTQVGTFPVGDMSRFIAAIDHLATAMAVISRTPKHYFFLSGGDPSGESLLMQESPLVKKCNRYIRRYGNTWQRFGAFILLLETGQEVDPEDITPLFDDPESVQPKANSERRKVDRDCGIPLITLLRNEGWSTDEIAQLEKDIAADRAASVRSMADGLRRQQTRFNEGEEE